MIQQYLLAGGPAILGRRPPLGGLFPFEQARRLPVFKPQETIPDPGPAPCNGHLGLGQAELHGRKFFHDTGTTYHSTPSQTRGPVERTRPCLKQHRFQIVQGPNRKSEHIRRLC